MTSLSLLDDLRQSLPNVVTNPSPSSPSKQSRASEQKKCVTMQTGAEEARPRGIYSDALGSAPLSSSRAVLGRESMKKRRKPASEEENRVGSEGKMTNLEQQQQLGNARSIAMSQLDMGKMLASMDKASLLSVLHRLLVEPSSCSADDVSSFQRTAPINGTNSGQQCLDGSNSNRQKKELDTTHLIRSRILSLLPPPTLEMAMSALNEAVEETRRVLPAASAAVRPEWAWTRLQIPVEEFARVAKSFAIFFTMPAPLPLLHFGKEGNNNTIVTKDQTTTVTPVHPATSFRFYLGLTQLVLELQSKIPDVPKSMSAFPLAHSEPSFFSYATTSGAVLGHTAGDSLRDQLGLSSAAWSTKDRRLGVQLVVDGWTAWISALVRGMEADGRVYGQDILRGWIDSLCTLSNDSRINGDEDRSDLPQTHAQAQLKTFLAQVHATLQKKCAWMLGSSSALDLGHGARGAGSGTEKRRRSWAASSSSGDEMCSD